MPNNVGQSRAQLGMPYLTGDLDVGYFLGAGRADVRRLRAVPLS
jgi:hypothetical protein